MYSKHITDERAAYEQEKFMFRPEMDDIINRVASVFCVSSESVLVSKWGKMNLPRWAAMYLCQETGGYRLIDIAKKFGLKRTGSIPTTLGKLKEMLRVDQKLKDKVDSAI